MHLEIAALQHNFEQARPLEIVQRLLAQTDDQGPIGAFMQQLARFHGGLRFEPMATGDGFDPIEPLVTFDQEMFQAKVLAGKDDDAVADAIVCCTRRMTRARFHFRSSCCRGV